MVLEAFLATLENSQDGDGAGGVGERLLAITHAIEKVFAFAAERFVSGELDGLDILFKKDG